MSILKYRLIDLGTHGIFQVLEQRECDRRMIPYSTSPLLSFTASNGFEIRSSATVVVDSGSKRTVVYIRGSLLKEDMTPTVFEIPPGIESAVFLQNIHDALGDWAKAGGFGGKETTLLGPNVFEV